MNKIHIAVRTTVSPERVVQALTDFNPQRTKLLSNIDPRFYQLHSVGTTSADVTEGSNFLGGIWERSTYDWSQPGEIHITLQSSNAFVPGGYWHYHVARTEDGESLVELTVDRRGKNLKGYVLTTLLSFLGRKLFSQSLAQTLKSLEAEAMVSSQS
ncbi:hypothetical protein [Dictyobacter aurantiacus]|uniref:Uncharacterized protein n=1 Tax=Dictyobacter aurantiacus TaxID=1936993 RepID=A0A401ZT68_9CHLR|nr:hypothetical protein [Dictyobacter aurantiacus]GCE10075.1 hypothetical protein KDAU_74040 [Dictyobacter aurantiacus]